MMTNLHFVQYYEAFIRLNSNIFEIWEFIFSSFPLILSGRGVWVDHLPPKRPTGLRLWVNPFYSLNTLTWTVVYWAVNCTKTSRQRCRDVIRIYRRSNSIINTGTPRRDEIQFPSMIPCLPFITITCLKPCLPSASSSALMYTLQWTNLKSHLGKKWLPKQRTAFKAS